MVLPELLAFLSIIYSFVKYIILLRQVYYITLSSILYYFSIRKIMCLDSLILFCFLTSVISCLGFMGFF